MKVCILANVFLFIIEAQLKQIFPIFLSLSLSLSVCVSVCVYKDNDIHDLW